MSFRSIGWFDYSVSNQTEKGLFLLIRCLPAEFLLHLIRNHTPAPPYYLLLLQFTSCQNTFKMYYESCLWFIHRADEVRFLEYPNFACRHWERHEM